MLGVRDFAVKKRKRKFHRERKSSVETNENATFRELSNLNEENKVRRSSIFTEISDSIDSALNCHSS